MQAIAHILNGIGLVVLVLLFFYRIKGDIHDVVVETSGHGGMHKHENENENEVRGVHAHVFRVKPIFTQAYISYERKIKIAIFIAAFCQLLAASIFAYISFDHDVPHNVKRQSKIEDFRTIAI